MQVERGLARGFLKISREFLENELIMRKNAKKKDFRKTRF